MKIDQLQPWPKGEPPAPSLCGETARASILLAYGLDALEDDPELSEITQFAAKLCDVPVALVSLVEKERQRFLARAGLEERETPRPTSFCAHAMLHPEPMVVPDALLDERFSVNPLVTGHPHIRFYAGAPLISHEGAPLGSLCVIDTRPRPERLTEIQRDGLEVLAASVMRRLRHRRERLRQTADLRQSERNLRALSDSIPDIAWSSDAAGKFDYYNARWKEFTGGEGPISALDWEPFMHPEDFPAAREAWFEKLESGESFETEYRMRTADGSYRWVLSRANPVERNDGSVQRWFGTVTDIDDARRRSDERDLLARELSHRIKNIFAVIGGLISLKGRDYPDAKPLVDDMTETLHSLSRAHRYVTQEQSNGSETLHGLLSKLLTPYGDQSGSRLELSGDDVPVNAQSATPLALVFHELATNSAKYGSLSVPQGRVTIVTENCADQIVLTWRETGGPEPERDRGSGFGSRLIEKSISSQLSGTLTRAFDPAGLSAILTIPVASL